MLRKIIKILPSPVYNYLKFLRYIQLFFPEYLRDCKRYIRYSASQGYNNECQLSGGITLRYHVIEKGLTMPELRLGFGKGKLLELIDYCVEFEIKYGRANNQLLHAVGVIKEYKVFHKDRNFKLDNEVQSAIDKIDELFPEICATMQKTSTPCEYFKQNKDNFELFSASRASIRDFSDAEEVSLDTVLQALELARNTPSACNRQTWRSYVVTDKEKINTILECQGGNRGFGHLTDKLVIVTSDLGVFAGYKERNQAFVDGGMHVMNILYALHYYNIGACTLNCCVDETRDSLYREICQVKQSEVFISMIACGVPKNEFKFPISKRYELDFINRVVD